MIGCSPVLALTKVPSYSMTTIIAFQNGLQKSSSSMKVWQSWKYKKFTGLACGDAESKYWIRFSRGGGGEIKKDKRWENFKSDLGVTLQGNRGRLPAHLELLARISSLHHHALNNKISSRPTMHWWWLVILVVVLVLLATCWASAAPWAASAACWLERPESNVSSCWDNTWTRQLQGWPKNTKYMTLFFSLPPTCCCWGSWGAVLSRVQRRRVQP